MSKVARVDRVSHAHTHHKEVKKGKRRVKKGSEISQNLVPSDDKAMRASQILQRAQEWTSHKNAKGIIKKYGEDKLERMIMACEHIWKLSHNPGMKMNELFKIAKFIETKLPGKVKKGKRYFRKEKTHLARTIEYKSKNVFIHLKTHGGISPLGEGCHKTCSRSIMYAAHNPEIVANCVGDKTVGYEGKVLQKLGVGEGIVKTYAVSKHRKKNSHKKIYSVITKLYNSHTVRSYEYNRSTMNHKEEIYIARDLMKGLEHMHAKRKAHCDLHSGNFMVHKEVDSDTGKSQITAALIDFGQVVSFNKAKKKAPKIEISRHLITPEALIKGKHRVDIRKIESYAIGCSLYHLFFGQGPEWCEKMKQRDVKHMSSGEKKALSYDLTLEIKKTIAKRRKDLPESHRVRREFGHIIFDLLDPDPKKRLSPAAARRRLEGVIRQLES